MDCYLDDTLRYNIKNVKILKNPYWYFGIDDVKNKKSVKMEGYEPECEESIVAHML